jgi:thioredoxin reductase
VDDLQETSIAGIYAAGDNAFPARIISYAVAAGTRAGIAINAKLVAEVV